MALSVPEVARRCGISVERVRQLARSGDLPAQQVGGVWVIDEADLSAFRATRRAGGRPVSPSRAWALLSLLAGESDLSGLSASGKWQIKQLLARLAGQDAVGWRSALAARQEDLAFDAHPSVLNRLLAGGDPRVFPSMAPQVAAELGLSGGSNLLAAVLISAEHLPEVVDEYALQRQRGGNLRVKVPRQGWPASLEVAALADMLDVPDARAQAASAARLNELAGS